MNKATMNIYVSKKHKELIKKNELNYHKINLESYEVYIYGDNDNDDYILFEVEETSCKLFSKILKKLYNYLDDDFKVVIKLIQDNITFNINIKNKKILINDYTEEEINQKLNILKTYISEIIYQFSEYETYINDYEIFDNAISHEDLEYYDIQELDDLIENNQISLFDIPYLEEISGIITKANHKLSIIYKQKEKEIFDSLPDLEIVEYEEPEPLTIFKSEKSKKKETSWKNEEFEREADLWGLSESDRKLAKEERMTPAEFIEAEEYNDDELLLDEWER